MPARCPRPTGTAQAVSRYVWDLLGLAPGAGDAVTVSGDFTDGLLAGTRLALSAEMTTAILERSTANNRAWLSLGDWYPICLLLVQR